MTLPEINRQPGAKPGIVLRPAARPVTAARPPARVSALDRIEGIDQADDGTIQVLLYGRSGTGKTTLWSTFPGPILVLVCSGGLRPGELKSVDTPANRGRIKQVQIRHGDDAKEVANGLKAGDPRVSGYKTIVLDHASGLQDRILADILNMDELPAQKHWGLARKQDYGQCGAQWKEYVRTLLSVPGTNTVIVAHERDFSNEDDQGDDGISTPFISAGLMPTLETWVTGAVDYTCQTFLRQKEKVTLTKRVGGKPGDPPIETRTKLRGQVEYCLRTAPDGVHQSKFRGPVVQFRPPPVMVDPTYDKLLQLIQQLRAEQLEQ